MFVWINMLYKNIVLYKYLICTKRNIIRVECLFKKYCVVHIHISDLYKTSY